MIRKTLFIGMPIGLISAAVIVENNGDQKEKLKNPKLICKPSELPIYTSLVDSGSKKKCECEANKKSSAVASAIEESVKAVRTELTKVTDVYDSQKANIERYYVTFMKDTQHIRNYLQEEDNTMPRVGAIAISSLAGVILGIRGGFFKKLFYASLTGSSMAAVCYPREAKKYATIAYNFAYGKNPNDAGQKDLPKLPTSFGEMKMQLSTLSEKAYDAVFKK
ncbi:hypothetical protein PVAND_011326 [Polypedilum vanderplanki]|uniref:MICOS complex subunit n=1 Tax=Polypedilum vanderplanki TaxID=319348 RepID=A0A9J6CJM5_POLVA|nr:hypothetical protein PVAND_011326 [Polypedilum vanderplanki]